MKRIRLIALMLMTVLIVALVSVSVFAGVTGNEKSLTANMENLTPVEGATPNATTLGGSNFYLYNTTGTYDIIKNPEDGNTYLNYHHYGNTGGAWVGNYIRVGSSGSYTPLSSYRYMTFDFDLWSPTGSMPDGTQIFFYLRAVSGNAAFGKEMRLRIGMNSDGSNYLCFNDNTSTKVQFDNTVWNHITFLLDVATENTASWYIFLNGELVLSRVDALAGVLDDFSVEYAETMRMVLVNGTESQTTALDNLAINTYTTSYTDTTLATAIASGDITDWAHAVYTDDYVMPFANLVCEVDGVQYDSINKASEANPGEVIRLAKDLDVLSVGASVKVDLNGHSVGSVVAQSGYNYTYAGDELYVFYPNTIENKGYLDFESATVGSSSLSANVNYGNGYTFIYQSANISQHEIVEQSNGNRYLKYSYNTSSGTPYFTKVIASASYSSGNVTMNEPLQNYSYHIADLDFFSHTSMVAQAIGINFQVRYYSTSGSHLWYHTAEAQIRHDSAKGLNYIATQGGNVYLDENTWSHITLVLASSVTANNTYKLDLYLFVNGVSCGLVSSASPTKTDMAGSTLHAYVNDMRIIFNHTNATSDCTASIDNINVRRITKVYTGNLASVLSSGSALTEWEGDIYNPDALPFGLAVARIGEAEYDTIAKALADAKAGDTITIVKSTDEGATVNKAVTINKGAYTTGTFTAGTGLVSVADGATIEFLDAVSSDLAFEYVSGGVTTYAKSGDSAFVNAINSADEGTTVRFLKDCTVLSSKDNFVVSISKNLTIDLDGNTFTLNTEYVDSTNNGQSFISIAGTAKVKFIDGRICTGYITNISSNKEGTKAYPLVRFSGSATLELENVDTYVGSLFLNAFTANIKPTVIVKGGEHHSYLTTYGARTGFISSQASVSFTATDASFYIGSSCFLISSCHRMTNSGGTASDIAFNRCDIIASSASKNLMDYSSNETTISFNGCNILGSINPTIATWGTYAATSIGTITLGEGTALAEGYTLASGVSAENGYYIKAQASSKQVSFHSQSGNYYTDNFAIAEAPTRTTYTFAYVVAEEEIPVNVYWYDENGSLIATTEVYKNAYAVPPSFTPTTITDGQGYYKQSYDVWSTSQGGEAVDSLLITGETSFYLTLGEVKPYLTSAMFNLKLMGHTQLNFYIPYTLPDYVSLTGVYNSAGNAISAGSSVRFDDVLYRSYVANYLGATNLHGNTILTVKYTVTVDEVAYDLTQRVTISPLAYIRLVLSDYEAGTGKFDAKTYGICANLLRYSKAVHDIYGTSNDDTNTLLAKYEASLCDPIDNTVDTDFPEGNIVDLGDLSKYIKSITFQVDSYEPRFKVVFKDFYSDEDDTTKYVTGMYLETIGYIGASAKGEYEANWGLQTYTYSAKWGVYHIDPAGQLVNASNGSVCNENGAAISGTAGDVSEGALGVVYTQNIPIYNIDGDKTVVLTLNDGTVVTGEYNIDTYYNGIKDTAEEDLLLKTRYFLKAMREYSEAVQRYRFPIGMFPYVNEEAGTINANSFGAKGDGVTDDYAALKKMFDFANKMGYDVVFPEGTYYIGDSVTAEISVKTNVDFSKATFTFDDASVGVSSNARTKHIFQVISDSTTSYDSSTTPIASLSRGATNVGWAPGYKALLVVTDNTRTHFIRAGANSDSGEPIKEVILVDANGNVDSSTPVIYDYATVTSLKVYSAEDETLTITGGTFNTTANTAPAAYTYYGRGICIQRSNVIVDGVTHTISGEGDSGAPYNGFIAIQGGHNVVIQNSTLQAHKAYDLATDSSNTMGTYDISIGSANAVTIKNVHQSNFFASDGTLTINGDETQGTRYWGIMGTNETKNITVDGSTLSRVDAHRGVYNVNIINSSRVAHITLIGEGTFNLKNSEVYIGSRATVITLRQDYGATWRGTFNIEDAVVKYTNADITGIELVGGAHTEGHDFGYNLYLPETINVTNLTTKRITRTGIADSTETVNATNEEKLAFYASTNNSMGSTVTRTCTSTININDCSGITSTSKLILPNNSFFDGMVVNINGSKVNWSGSSTSSFNFGSTSSDDSSCLVEGTLITMADGSLKPIEELTADDEILVFNHESGKYEAGKLWFTVHGELPREERTVLNLVFSDDTVIRIVHEHALFDSTLAKYVYLSVDNAEDYIGHEFLSVNGKVTLDRAYTTSEAVKVYSPISELHLNVIAAGMITATTSLFDLNEMLNAYEYDENGVYLADKRAEDLEKYGVYEYSEFAHLFSEAEYNASPLYYLKVAVGKGLITRENIEALIKACVALGYMEAP